MAGLDTRGKGERGGVETDSAVAVERVQDKDKMKICGPASAAGGIADAAHGGGAAAARLVGLPRPSRRLRHRRRALTPASITSASDPISNCTTSSRATPRPLRASGRTWRCQEWAAPAASPLFRQNPGPTARSGCEAQPIPSLLHSCTVDSGVASVRRPVLTRPLAVVDRQRSRASDSAFVRFSGPTPPGSCAAQPCGGVARKKNFFSRFPRIPERLSPTALL